MKHVKLFLGAVLILSTFAFTLIKAINWKVKGGYEIKAQGDINEGIFFKGLKSLILFDEANPQKSIIKATVDANSLSSGNKTFDDHAKEALETQKYPSITFASTEITKTKQGYEATGDLTLKGITKQIKFPFVFNSQKDIGDRFPFVAKETFSGKIIIAAKDFNITRKGTPDQIIIDLTLPVTK